MILLINSKHTLQPNPQLDPQGALSGLVRPGGLMDKCDLSTTD